MASTRVTSNATHGAVSVDATAEIIVDGTTGRSSLLIQNVHATQVLYLGTSSGVTTANGIKILAGESISFDDYQGEVWGIASGAATDTRYWETH